MTASRRILVVDDQPETLELAATILEGEGYRVVGALSGGEALDLLAGERFDLVLLDINMPGMDGWETLRLIRADESMAGLPVVMFSVKSELRDKVYSMQEGALDYITKPFSLDDLVRRVRRVFEAVPGGEPGRPGSPAVP